MNIIARKVKLNAEKVKKTSHVDLVKNIKIVVGNSLILFLFSLLKHKNIDNFFNYEYYKKCIT